MGDAKLRLGFRFLGVTMIYMGHPLRRGAMPESDLTKGSCQLSRGRTRGYVLKLKHFCAACMGLVYETPADLVGAATHIQ